MKTNEKLNLFNFGLMDMEVKHLEMIQENLEGNIDSYLTMLNDDEFAGTKEDLRDLCLSLLMEDTRVNNQLCKCVENIRDENNRQLNSVNGKFGDNQIRPYFNMNFKEQFAGWR